VVAPLAGDRMTAARRPGYPRGMYLCVLGDEGGGM